MKKAFLILITIGIIFGISADAHAAPASTIVVIDTGVDMTNKIVSNRIVGEVCILVQNTCPNGSNFMEGSGSATLNPSLAINNGFYHGTQMAGIIVENSNASIIMIRIIGMNANGTRSTSNVSVIERALRWVVDNQYKYNISEVSISQTIRTTTTCLINKSVESSVLALKNSGIVVVSASGNDSDYVHTNFPACLKDVISIGATDPATIKGEYPALYSNLSDDFYILGTMNTYINSTTKARSVGTSNATALFASRWFNLDNGLSYQQKYDKIKSLAKVVSTAKVTNVLVVK